LDVLGIKRTYRNLARITQILQVFVRHRFGYLIERMELKQHLPFAAKILRKRPLPESEALSAPRRLAMAFEELGPTFVKLGQVLSSRPDVVPLEYAQELRKLQDRVAPFESDKAFALVEKELKRPLGELFAQIDAQPFAAGSLAQVYNATLKTGERVVVKVKRPGIDEQLATDIQILKGLSRLAERRLADVPIFPPALIVEEFERTIRRELDFLTEAASTDRFYREFKDSPLVKTPSVFWNYSTISILTVERLEGINITEAQALGAKDFDGKQLARHLLEVFIRQYFSVGFFHADPHPGNVLVGPNSQLILIDFGMVGRLSGDLKSQLVTTLYAAANRDVEVIIDIYADIGVFQPTTDMESLKTDVESLIDHYYGFPIKRVDFRELAQEILDLARNHHVRLPRDFVLLLKSLATVTGLARMLDPEIDLIATIKPHTRKILYERFLPHNVKSTASMAAWYMQAFAKKAPLQLKALSRKLQRGELGFTFKHQNFDHFIQEVDRSSNRLAFSITLAAIIVGSSLIIMSDKGPKLQFLDISLLGFAGYLFAGILGIFLLVAILKSNKL